MQKNETQITQKETENLLDLAEFLRKSVIRLVEEGKICKTEFPVLFVENSSKQNGQKKTNPISPVKIVESKSLSGMTRE